MKKIKITCLVIAALVVVLIFQWFNGNYLGCWIVNHQTQQFLDHHGYDDYEVSESTYQQGHTEETEGYNFFYFVFIKNVKEDFLVTIEKSSTFSDIDQEDFDEAIEQSRNAIDMVANEN